MRRARWKCVPCLRDDVPVAREILRAGAVRRGRLPRAVAAFVVVVAGCVTALAQAAGAAGTSQATRPVQATTGVQSGVENGVLTPAQTGVQPGAQPAGSAQVLPLSPQHTLISPLVTPTISPGALTLLELEGRFSQAVATGGGKVFAQWFAEDAVTLNNGQPAVQGRGNIAAQAVWSPADYQLSWVPQGAQMGPSNDMGFTWGTYLGKSKDKNGEIVTTTGRYMTVWKKQKDGSWKVAMDASANDAPLAGSCCTLPKP